MIIKPNPKDVAAYGRVRLDLIPGTSQIPEAMALADGAQKYGEWNWRLHPIKASNYIAATLRHIKAWQDREEYASDSLVHHLGHAKASLAILMDAGACDTLIDDRPPAGPTAALLAQAAARK